MIFSETPLSGAYSIEPEPHSDNRGFFARTFCEREFEERGITFRAVQANVSYNRTKHTLRGMHFNTLPHEEAKVVSCIRGSVFDVIVDLRPDSPCYRRWTGLELTAANRKMLYIPEGFAHGFITLEDNTEVHYLMSDFYVPGAAAGFRWDEPAAGIKWPAVPAVISEKDLQWPPLGDGAGDGEAGSGL